MKHISLYILFLAAFLAFAGCSKKSNNNPVSSNTTPQNTQPDFNIAAVNVTMSDGSDGLQFAAHCTTDDIDLIKVVVVNPAQVSVTYNEQNTLFLENQEFECQAGGTGYYKVLGTWQLTFVGNKAAGTKASFSVTKTLTVTGKILAK